MNMKAIKRRVRRIAHRLGVMQDWEQRVVPKGGEQPAEWYDKAFTGSEEYNAHYTKSCYYAIWSVIVDRIVQGGAGRILDIGCGPGQLANYLWDQGARDYVGLDFSGAAIDIARKRNPTLEFFQGDARSSEIHERINYNFLICTEVLEHIEEDLLVVSRFRAGCRCLCTVPNFPWTSHVRHFENARQVYERYGPYFDNLKILTFKGTRFPNEEFFLIDGIRNNKVSGG